MYPVIRVALDDEGIAFYISRDDLNALHTKCVSDSDGMAAGVFEFHLTETPESVVEEKPIEKEPTIEEMYDRLKMYIHKSKKLNGTISRQIIRTACMQDVKSNRRSVIDSIIIYAASRGLLNPIGGGNTVFRINRAVLTYE